MKIAILGTRGIPNKYGGFEEFAESISKYLVQQGHKVSVYCVSKKDSEKYEMHQGVQLVNIPEPTWLSSLSMLVYDYRCLKHALTCNYELIIECGYTFSPLIYLLKQINASKFIVMMDGMEWQRSKWGFATKAFIRFCERLCVKKFKNLLVDHPVIADYYLNCSLSTQFFK